MLTKDDCRVWAERCRERAHRFPQLHEVLLEIADRYELDARLVEASRQAVAESKRLIVEADKLIVPLKARLSSDSGSPGHCED
jgi:hypothetical protein